MIIREQVSEMIYKHFGEVNNREEFLDELFENNNVVLRGRLTDEGTNFTDDCENAFKLNVDIEAMGESSIITIYNSKNSRGWNGVLLRYYNQEDSYEDLIFHCKSIDSKNEFVVESNSEIFYGKFSIKMLKYLVDLEFQLIKFQNTLNDLANTEY